MGSTGGGDAPEVKPTAAEKAAAEIGAREYNNYVTRFVPQEEIYKQQLAATPAKRALAAGMVTTDAAIAGGQMSQQAQASGLAAGAQMGSGRQAFATGAVNDAVAGARGLGAAQAVQGVDDRDLEGKLQLVSFGRGLASQAASGMISRAANATQSAISRANLKLQNQLGLQQALGTGVGAFTSFSGVFDKKPAAEGTA